MINHSGNLTTLMDSSNLFLPVVDGGAAALRATDTMTLAEKIQYHYEELLKLIARDATELSDLKDIVRDKLAELVNRTRNSPSAFNNYMAAKHHLLPQEQQTLGQNTQAIAQSWRQKDAMEKLRWRSDQLKLLSLKKQQDQQMKTAVHHLKHKVHIRVQKTVKTWGHSADQVSVF